MQTIATVFTIMGAIAAGLLLCLEGLKELVGHHKWLNALKFMLCLVVLFGGPVAAADAAVWSYVIAVERYPGVGPELIAQLPIQLLRRVFETRLAECQQLTFEDFKAECLCDMSFYDMSGFGRNAALLLFVEPSQVAECCQWFVKCTVIWKAYKKVKGAGRVSILRYMWTNSVFNADIRASCTLHSISNMNLELQDKLYRALFTENPKDPWIMANLPKPSDIYNSPLCGDAESPVSSDRENTQRPVTVSLEDWYAMGVYAECRFCRFCPPDIKIVPHAIGKTMRHLYPWARHCGACGYNVMKFGLVEGSISVVAVDEVAQSTAGTDNQIREDK
ncbi:hypothetical protein PSACC_02139 [Paramicrosporidium saccamoebae]|uniref:Uncharacterized protein n=1 Tax=Paramicrosporidium saccamoebae TaxID=1246581 RepID=A0A2H9TJZ6_9FUNG|nr:hypothetical protein PSACC_02139 [Paramicrosporidium saccamoebae]